MKIKSKKKKRTALKIVLIILLTALFIGAAICNNYIPRNVADYYCTKIFPVISKPLQCFYFSCLS